MWTPTSDALYATGDGLVVGVFAGWVQQATGPKGISTSSKAIAQAGENVSEEIAADIPEWLPVVTAAHALKMSPADLWDQPDRDQWLTIGATFGRFKSWAQEKERKVEVVTYHR